MLNNAALWIRDTIPSHVWQIDQAIIDASKKVYYAVDITLDCSACTSIPSIGLFSQHMRLITGRPGFIGMPGQAFYEGGIANNEYWCEGILLDRKIGVSSQSIDVTVMGEVGSFSGFRFSINDCEKQWQYINSNAVQFVNRKITHYVVLDNIFYALWSGVIEDTQYNDTEVVFQCVNAFNAVHKPMPPRSAVQPEYPDAEESDSAKTIPIVIGDMVDASLVLTKKEVNYLDITGLPNNPYVAGLAQYYIEFTTGMFTNPVAWSRGAPRLITFDKYFAANELAGKYLLVVNGGGNVKKNKMIRIVSNEASYLSILPLNPGGTTWKKYITQIDTVEAMSDLPDIRTNFIWNYSLQFKDITAILPFTSDFLVTRWFVKILDFTMEYSFSNLSVSDILLNAEGLPIIRVWNEQAKQYDDISKLFESYDLSTGTISIKPKIFTDENSAQYNTFYKPEIISFRPGFLSSYTTSGSILYRDDPGDPDVVEGDIASLTDKSRATYMSVSVLSQQYVGGVIEMPISDAIKNALGSGDTRVVADLSIVVPTVKDYYITVSVQGRDIYGRPIPNANIKPTVINIEKGKIPLYSLKDLNMIDDSYYSAAGLHGEICDNNSIFETTLDTTTEYNFLGDVQKMDESLIALIKNGVVDRLIFVATVEAVDHGGQQMQINFKEIAIVQTSSADIESDNIFASVKGEKYSTYDTDNVYRALQHILVDYDGISSADIDFGNLPSKRQSWNVGRQLTERKSSLDYISEMCKQAFIAYWQKRGGALAFQAWKEDTDIAAFHDDSIILRNSIDGVTRTRVSELYNEFSIRYGWSNVLDDYTKEFFITKIDAIGFPASSDALWKTYVGGLSDSSYADAKALWDQCHAAWLKSNTINKLEVECPWFPDLSAFPDYAGGGVGTGSSAFKLLQNLVEWATWQKKIVKYEVGINSDTVKLELMQYISFEDVHITDSIATGGWIIGIASNPETNTRAVSLLLSPILSESEQDNLIIETGSSPTIIETGSNPETIIEGA